MDRNGFDKLFQEAKDTCEVFVEKAGGTSFKDFHCRKEKADVMGLWNSRPCAGAPDLNAETM